LEIIVNWGLIKSEKSFYEIFLSQVKAPDWHGHNLDALADSIISGDINAVEPPYTIKSINTSKVRKEMKVFQTKVLSLFLEVTTEQKQIKLIVKK